MNANREAMTALRICLWLVPGMFLFLGFLLLFALPREMPIRFILVLIFCLFIGLGYIDMRLKLHIDMVEAKPLKKRIFGWAVAFAFVQILIAPAVAVVLGNICFRIAGKSFPFP
jgi:hypothetical protein